MNRPWFALWKALLNVNFGFSAIRHRVRERERVWELLLTGVAIVGVAIGLLTTISLFVSRFIDAGLALGQPELVLTLAHLVAAVLVFVFGIVFVMGALFFAKDAHRLISLPLRARHIITAKFATVLVNEYITTALVLLPVYIIYALKVHVSGWFFPVAIIAFLLTPMIPLALSTLLVLVLMRVASGTKMKDLFTIVGGLLAIVISMGFQYFFRSQLPGSEAESAALLFEQMHGLSQAVASGYPPSLWAMESLALAGTMSGLPPLLWLVLTGSALFVGIIVMGEQFLYRSIQAEGEHERRRSPVRSVRWTASAPIDAVAQAERRLFMRTPVFVLNGFAGFVLLPIILLFPFLRGAETITEVLSQIALRPATEILLLVAWFAFAAGTSSIPATAFSREGNRLWILKSLPISGKDFFLGKLKAGITLTMLGTIPGVLVLVFLLKLNLVASVVGIALGATVAILMSMISLTIDVQRPLLNWTEPTRAIKSNLNVMISLVAVIAILGAAWLIGKQLLHWGVSENALVIIAWLASLLSIFTLWRLVAPRLEGWLWRMGD